VITVMKCPKCKKIWGCRETIFNLKIECCRCSDNDDKKDAGCYNMKYNFPVVDYLCYECFKKVFIYSKRRT